MAEPSYDDPDFFEAYTQLPRQTRGLEGAGEWSALQSMLPSIKGKNVLDLGCGFGWHARWAIANGAASVLGIDVSERMLQRAHADSADEVAAGLISYRKGDFDDLQVDADSFGLAFSSLALHYAADLPSLLGCVAASLRPGGHLVFSVEHPIYSAPSVQALQDEPDGRRVWPLENYLVEGPRQATWLGHSVGKQHRTVASYVNGVISVGLVIDEIVEWGPSAAQVAAQPRLADDLHRPWFLLVAATKPARH